MTEMGHFFPSRGIARCRKPRPAGASRAGELKRASCSPRPTAGSQKASTRPIWKRRRRCCTRWNIGRAKACLSSFRRERNFY